MRFRFFLTILVVLFVVTLGSVGIHSLFLRKERLNLIDQQVRETASALVDSELGGLRIINFDQADEIISDELGESRIGKFFIIRNGRDEIIFESTSAKILALGDIPRTPQWVQINTKGKFIRVLNLALPRIPDRTLQVGLVLDKNLVEQKYFLKTSLMFVAVVLTLGFIASLFLTSFLLKPVARLERFLTGLATQSRSQAQLPAVPDNLLSRSHSRSRDEFEKMVFGLNTLISKVNKNYLLSRIWAYQMAHELKTPLSILTLEIEKLQKRMSGPTEEIHSVNGEVVKISETIGSFLSWAELENSSQQKHLFINRIGALTQEVCRRLESTNPKRIVYNMQADFVVLSSPQHLEQLVSNLILNALSYSSPSKSVYVELQRDSILVSDGGKGIPKGVMDRLGEPFNRGSSGENGKGHGLGLAWVNSVCRLYSWNLSVNSNESGTKIAIQFPSEKEIFESKGLSYKEEKLNNF